MGIQVKNINKKFKDFVALDNVNLDVKSGELIALLGPSGSGKTTLLRIIAGLELADNGTVLLDGKEALDKDIQERHIGFVFQHYALFKHMTVFENVAFGLRVRPKKTRLPNFQIEHKVRELLRLVQLGAFESRYPHQLSGGQRQRVALARALAVQPKVLLLDEPFGALDAKVRKELRRWLRRLHDEMHITTIFVTHDQEEAMEVADRVVVMKSGHIEQVGAPEEVYHHPASSFVYDFLGNYNQFDGWKDKEGNVHLAETDLVETPDIPVTAPKASGLFNFYPEITNLVNKVVPGLLPQKTSTYIPTKKQKVVRRPGEGHPVQLFARPHEMYITTKPDDNEYITAKVVYINPAGPLVKIELERNNGMLLQVETPKSVVDLLKIKRGQTLFVRPKQTKVFG